MGGGRIPGPQSQHKQPANINDGTLCRQPSPSAGPVGLACPTVAWLDDIGEAIKSSLARNLRRVKVLSLAHVDVWRLANDSALFFMSGLAIDADGSPQAYHEGDRGEGGLKPLDVMANSSDLIRDKGGNLHKQTAADPAPGFFVSPTSLTDSHITDPTNPRRYVNSGEIPYITLPGGTKYYDRAKKEHHHPSPFIAKLGVSLGDFAAVINTQNNQISYAIFAEIGPPGKIGEGSIALADELGIDSSPVNGGTAQKVVQYIIFPGSGNGEPRTLKEIKSAGEKLYGQWIMAGMELLVGW